jgi:predicted nucleotidyltransferase
VVTALKMTDSEQSRRARVLAARHRVLDTGQAGPSRELLAKIREVARLLHSQFGADVVTLFGSSVQGGMWWRASSDIDLAVKGIAGRDFWHAWAAIEGMIPERRIDLVDVDMATDSLKRAIVLHGIRL